MKNWRRYLPYIDFWLDIGLLQLKTHIWCDAMETCTFEYVCLEGRVLYKWGFRWRLYQTDKRMVDR